MAESSLTMTDAIAERDQRLDVRSGTLHLARLSAINNNGRAREVFEHQPLEPRGTVAPEARDDDSLDAGIGSRMMRPDVILLTATRRVR